jgi:hypothetical protein
MYFSAAFANGFRGNRGGTLHEVLQEGIHLCVCLAFYHVLALTIASNGRAPLPFFTRLLRYLQTPDKRSKGFDKFGDFDPSMFPAGMGSMSSSMAGKFSGRSSMGVGDFGGGAADHAHAAMMQVEFSFESPAILYML